MRAAQTVKMMPVPVNAALAGRCTCAKGQLAHEDRLAVRERAEEGSRGPARDVGEAADAGRRITPLQFVSTRFRSRSF